MCSWPSQCDRASISLRCPENVRALAGPPTKAVRTIAIKSVEGIPTAQVGELFSQGASIPIYIEGATLWSRLHDDITAILRQLGYVVVEDSHDVLESDMWLLDVRTLPTESFFDVTATTRAIASFAITLRNEAGEVVWAGTFTGSSRKQVSLARLGDNERVLGFAYCRALENFAAAARTQQFLSKRDHMVDEQPTFEDDFSDEAIGWPKGWPMGKSLRGYERGYLDGKYRIRIRERKGAGGLFIENPLAPVRPASLKAEADIVLRTDAPSTLYGLSCVVAPSVWYLFAVGAAGRYFIVRVDKNTQRSELLARGSAADRIRGIGVPNRIGAECLGGDQNSLLRLSVNGNTVAETQGRERETFRNTAIFVTTLRDIADSTGAVIAGVDNERPEGPMYFEAEVHFDNLVFSRAPLMHTGAPNFGVQRTPQEGAADADR